jgi:hypothetical protein
VALGVNAGTRHRRASSLMARQECGPANDWQDDRAYAVAQIVKVIVGVVHIGATQAIRADLDTLHRREQTPIIDERAIADSADAAVALCCLEAERVWTPPRSWRTLSRKNTARQWRGSRFRTHWSNRYSGFSVVPKTGTRSLLAHTRGVQARFCVVGGAGRDVHRNGLVKCRVVEIIIRIDDLHPVVAGE